ncbi:MAG: TetR/AcrR family transcriptional regulator [Deltaproteobacteria bacterium]|nr:TetR/AcrR family transcriptional regulator [Deltaproteobacteria bacterium]
MVHDKSSHRGRTRARTGRGRGKYDRTQSAEERRELQRGLLLDAATTVFAARGFAGATVEAIIEKAGMSRRTFYDHFEDIHDVLHQVHDRASGIAFRVVSELVHAEPDPIERIRTGITAYMTMIATHPQVASVVLREVRSAGPAYEPRRELETTRYASLLFEALAAAHAAKKTARPPDELTVYALATAIEAVAMRYIARREEARAAEAAPKLVELVLRAFG